MRYPTYYLNPEGYEGFNDRNMDYQDCVADCEEPDVEFIGATPRRDLYDTLLAELNPRVGGKRRRLDERSYFRLAGLGSSETTRGEKAKRETGVVTERERG